MDDSDFEARWQREEIRFLDIEIDTAMTFYQIAAASWTYGRDAERFQRVLAAARRAYTTVEKHLPRVKDEMERRRLSERFQQLTQAVGVFEDRMRPPRQELHD